MIQNLSHTKIDLEKFHNEGYLLIKNVFSDKEIKNLRDEAFKVFSENKDNLFNQGNSSFLISDLLTQSFSRKLVFDKRILEIARAILGREVIYYGYSSCQINWKVSFPFRNFGWHKDNRVSDRNDSSGLDWQGLYPMIRFGIYLQDHKNRNGGLSVKLKSHNSVQYRSLRTKIIDSEIGDLIVWNMRITHCGPSPRLKGILGRLNLDLLDPIFQGRLSRFIPGFLFQKMTEDRVAMFISYAAPSQHLDRYIQYLLEERPDEMEWFKRSRFGQDVWDQVQNSGLRLLRICPEYGTLASDHDQVIDLTPE